MNLNRIFFYQPLTKKRRYAAAAAIGKCLYIIGGYDTKTRLKSVEKLDLSEENPQWQSISPLLFRRALPAVCVHDSKSSNAFYFYIVYY
jgi:kelch-like protein 12